MKTADLIPLILWELNECDKYGFELTKSIETKTNGLIVIKQPTLYTLLKKLEKSKFIASYWQDSEIGGKRHYYKLTQNGQFQVSTLPSYESLLKSVLSDDEFVAHFETNEHVPTIATFESEKTTSIMDEILSTPTKTPKESVLPTDEVFAENNLDSSTGFEINSSNTEILKTEDAAIDEQFATSEVVSKFTEKAYIAPPVAESNETINQTFVDSKILDINFEVPKNEDEIKFVDYVDFKNTENYKYSKNLSHKMLLQTLSTCGCLVVALLLCTIISSFSGRSGLYYIFFIPAILITIFYPIIVAINLNKIRLKYQTTTFKNHIKLRTYIGLSAILLVFSVCVFVNIKNGNNTIALILNFKNFENLYAPLLLTSVYFIDIIFRHLFMSKFNK